MYGQFVARRSPFAASSSRRRTTRCRHPENIHRSATVPSTRHDLNFIPGRLFPAVSTPPTTTTTTARATQPLRGRLSLPPPRRTAPLVSSDLLAVP